MGIKSLAVVLALLVGAAIAEQEKFYGYKVFRITPKNEGEVIVVKALEDLGVC